MQSFALSKPDLDIGFFTNRIDETLAFWREEMGLAHEPPVHFNDGLTQYRHRLGNSIVKVNCAERGVNEDAAGGYGALTIFDSRVSEVCTSVDPNGQIIHRLPAETNKTHTLEIEVFAPDINAERDFFLNAMRWCEEPTGIFRSGSASITLTASPQRPYADHWVNAGFRYFTLHVMAVDACFDAMIDGGATVGEKPYAIGDIAKISFVRSPAGNWIEVAQRRELAGPW